MQLTIIQAESGLRVIHYRKEEDQHMLVIGLNVIAWRIESLEKDRIAEVRAITVQGVESSAVAILQKDGTVLPTRSTDDVFPSIHDFARRFCEGAIIVGN